MTLSALQETVLRFANAAEVQIREVCIDSPAVAAVLTASRNLFSCLDPQDPYQVGLIRQLWSLRACILFTLLPFDSDKIRLIERQQSLTDGTLQIPGARDAVSNLTKSMKALLARPENPKYFWLKTECGCSKGKRGAELTATGIFLMMAWGRTYGWPENNGGHMVMSVHGQIIDSPKILAGRVFDRIVIPGTCRYLSSRLYSEIFDLGRTSMVDVLLYPGETFIPRERLSPPDSLLFDGRLNASQFVTVSATSCKRKDGTDQVDTDEQIQQAMWQIFHEGQNAHSSDCKAARYILCKGGRGIFVPDGTHVLVWHEASGCADATLECIFAEQLFENDWIVIRPDGTGHLLDLLSAEDGFYQKMEEVCDWRPALDALMLTASAEQIAQEMYADGAHGVSLAHSLRNWVDGTVYGPGSQREFGALIAVLIRHDKLPEPENFERYVSDRWTGLRKLRGMRHRAGITLRDTLQQQIEDALRERAYPAEGHDSIVLENEVEVELIQVEAVDDRIHSVPVSLLSHLQFMRGGRWHG